jgi:ParB family protein of integrating conjugative element (PFGI_1 class)
MTMASTNKSKKKRAQQRKANTARRAGTAAPQGLRAEVTRIRAYERNPRHARNPEYDRIKASIRACGMDQPLRITRRPGETDYIVQAGGNTRLQVQKELYEATGEERFLWVDCLFVDWDRESAVLLAHLRENELRGNLSFIDRAGAVVEIQALAATELGVEALSDRQLEQFLTDHGYYASRSLISVMDYAVSVLLPVLPRALEAGLGRPQVQRIRDLQRVGQEVWKLHEAGEDAEFHEVFEALCRRHDHQDWVFDSLRQAVETEIAEAAEIRIQRIRMEFDCRLDGKAPEIPAFVIEETNEESHFPMSPRDEPNIVSDAERQALAQPESNDAGLSDVGRRVDAEQEPSIAAADSGTGDHEIAIELPLGPDLDAVLRRVGAATKGLMPLELLRKTAFELASQLAQGHGIGSLVEPLPEDGLGYLVLDVPPANVIDQLDPDLRDEVLTLWWQLTIFADMAGAPPDALQDRLCDDSEFAAAVHERDFARLAERVPPLDVSRLAKGFWARLGHETWCYWLCLAHNYRELQRTARETETPLWRTST